MSVYSFKITKDKYQLSLTTTDKDLVNEQFALWVRKASEYVQQHKVQQCKEMVNSQINAEEEITKKNIDEQLKRMPKADTSELSKADETSKNLDIFYAPNQSTENEKIIQDAINNDKEPERIVQEEIVEEKEAPTVEEEQKFDNILEQSIQAPQTELSFKPNPAIKKDNAFINFVTAKPVEKNIDYLLMTAYYFAQYEQKPRFTLKQLNAKLMQNIAVIIDHSVLQEAINRDYIECLPDLTGLIGTTEYRLTAYGEKVLLDD